LPKFRRTIKEIIKLDTHEFVARLKAAGATEEQATLALQAVSKAIETTKEGLVSKDALTDLKLFISTQAADTRAQIKADIKDLQFVVLATWSVLISALVIKYLLP
jgi:hypothetical protein